MVILRSITAGHMVLTDSRRHIVVFSERLDWSWKVKGVGEVCSPSPVTRNDPWILALQSCGSQQSTSRGSLSSSQP
ncbi:hypothetical protein PBY51_001857 [Eleginops maclovinus]|uniref:Uncharacterized protein n=1 Tax=Eleginops maclovinus TaxID=56733 RepID=A0AAN7WY73_ELEMC|nr:hypothetical protein PBY51_001857 [Eleginops maclovinus]